MIYRYTKNKTLAKIINDIQIMSFHLQNSNIEGLSNKSYLESD